MTKTTTSQYSNHVFDPGTRNNSWANMFHYIPAGSRVLDVGCSTANFGEALEQTHECTVVGVDLNHADIDEAKGKISEAYVLDVAAEASVALLGTFDVILFADVLEHLTDPRDTLRKVRPLLRDGGRIVYSIPNMGHLSVRLDLLEGRFPYTDVGLLDKTHLHFYDGPEIELVFSTAGYRITDEDPVVSEYPEGWVTERLARLGLAPGGRFFELIHASESHVYQYVGVAVPGPEMAGEPPPRPNRVTPPDEILAYANGILSENDSLKNEDGLYRQLQEERTIAEDLRGQVEHLRAEAGNLRSQVEAARAHMSFVKQHPLQYVSGKLACRLKRGIRDDG